MIARFTFEVTFADPTAEKARVTTGVRDYLEFERTYGVTVRALQDPKAEWLFFLAWSACHRQGVYAADFETFIDSGVEECNLVKRDVVDPTNEGQSPG